MLRTNEVGAVGAGGGDRLLLLVHGYGADEHDLAPLAPLLDSDGRFFTVCPRGPIDVHPFGGAAWYDRSEDGVIEPGSFQRSVLALDGLIAALCEQRGLQRRQAVVIGFSQGGAMALAVSLRETTVARPAGVACLSGMLPSVDGLRYAWDDTEAWAATAPADFPALYVQHGTYDPLVDVERGRRTREVLRSHGIEPEYHEYPMQHEIRPESIIDLRAWIDRVVAGS
jgi:phospholipase/carboxylesterase